MERERRERLQEKVKLLREANKAKAESNRIRAENTRLRAENERRERELQEYKEVIAVVMKPPPPLTLEERLRRSWEGGTLHLDIHDIADDFDVDVHEAWAEYEESVA